MRVLTFTKGESPEDKKSLHEFGLEVLKLKPGNYIAEIKRNRPIRSLQQNKFYWAILSIIAIDTGHTREELHEALKMKFNSEIVFFPKSGNQIIPKSTNDLDSAQFTAYINRVKQWARDEFNINIPEPKDLDYAKWIEIENTYEQNNQG